MHYLWTKVFKYKELHTWEELYNKPLTSIGQ